MNNKFAWVAAGLLAAAVHGTALSKCNNTKKSQTEDNRTALIPFGRVNLSSTHFQPVGSLLASVVVPPTNYTYGGAHADTILWDCLLSDMKDVHFLVATNGDDRAGGYYDYGLIDGLSDVYTTWFAYVGIRQTMAGVPLRRTWQAIPVTDYENAPNGRVNIRLKHLPTMTAELFRLSTLPGKGKTHYCGYKASDLTSGLGVASAAGTLYTCTQPNAYIQLVGPGLTHDNAGEDSADKFAFWGADNGFGYGMRSVNTLSNNATCMTRYATPQVIFPPTSVRQLTNGESVESSFTVQIECENSVSSGTGDGRTAIGIQVSPSAFDAAKKLGLVSDRGGVSALVDDEYFTNPNAAQGVGVYLKWAGQSATLNFVGQPGLTGPMTAGSGSDKTPPTASYPSGSRAGWYPVLTNASEISRPQKGYTNYQINYDVSLKRLPGKTVTPGTFRATAYVLVKVQ